MLAIQAATVVAVTALLSLGHQVYSFLPSPISVLWSGIDLLSNKSFYGHLGVTFYESLSGLLIAAVMGIAIGVSAGASRGATEFLTPIILAIYSVPKIVFLPVLLIVFGTGIPPKIANAALHALFPILLNSLVGMREVNPFHMKVAQSMLASRFHVVSKVILPSMVLPVFAGVKLGLGLSIMGALLAELFEARAGVGYLVTQYYSKGNISEMIAIVVVVFMLILIINAVMQQIESHLSRWRSP
ncbi:MAG: NitT/TauT family transport system permease protein [Alphaproteobacteria bacterium]|nr:NitT/TauT family transport system permease protein [Alphaproteobacteria bacterium]